MRRFLIVSILVAAVLSEPVLAQQNAVGPESSVREIGSLIRSQADMLMKKDAAGLARLFTGDAVYATASGAVYAGQDQIRDYYSKTIPALGKFTRGSAADEIHASGTSAWARGHGRTVVKTKEGVAELTDHWIAIYESVGGEWKVRALSLGENVTLLPARY
jgi:uncharacterized protein (TIGR02246 family)